MRQILLITFLTVFYNLGYSATISSKSSGGDWQSTSTWVGSTIPTATDDVIINGTVSGGGVCNDLTVSTAAILQNRSGYGETVTAYGDITNNGKISSSASGSFYISAYGLIKNYGIWQNSQLFLYQTGNALFYQSSGKYFNNMTITAQSGKADSLIMKTDVQFKSCYYTYSGTNKRILHSTGYTLNLTDCDVANFDFHSNDIIELENTKVRSCTFRGNGKIQGSFNVNQSATFDGNLTLEGRMTNTNGYSATIHIKGQMTNSDTIEVNKSGYLTIYQNGDFVNNGKYCPTSTYFKSGNSHKISQSAGKYFEGNYYSQGADTVILESALHFKKVSFYGNVGSGKGVINSTGHALRIDTSTIFSSTIVSNDTLLLKGSVINSTSVVGNFWIKGNYNVYGSTDFVGNIFNEGVVHNSPGYGVSIVYEGNLINDGTISLHPSGGSFTINLRANITNNGEFHPSSTLIQGDSLLTFRQNKTSYFEGSYATQDTSGGIKLGSSLTFQSANINWLNNYPYSQIVTNGFNLHLNKCEVRQVRFISEDTLNLDGSFFSNIQTFKTPKLTGNIRLYGNSIFNNGLINLDTIYQNPGSGISTDFYGSIENYGAIIKHPNGGVLNINLYGDLYNAGIYRPNSTYLMGSKPKVFKQNQASVFEGTYISEDTSGGIELGSNVTFNGVTIDWVNKEPYSKIVTSGHSLNILNSDIKQVRFISSDTLNLDGTLIRNIHTHQTPKLKGNIRLYANTKFIDGLINLDTIYQNPGNGIPTDFYGKVENYGAIIRHPSGGVLVINLFGELYNAGIYRPSTTYLKGTEPRLLSQNKSSFFEGTFVAEDTSSGIKLGSSLNLNSVNLNWVNKAPFAKLVTNGHNLNLINSEVKQIRFVSTDTLNLDGSQLSNIQTVQKPTLTGNVALYNNTKFNDGFINLDTIFQNAGYAISTEIYGTIENYGAIIQHPSGGILSMYLYGELNNFGIYHPTNTYLKGPNPILFKQSKNTQFEGNYYAEDTLSSLKLGSNIGFSNANLDWHNFEPYATINTNGFQLTLDNSNLRDIHITNSDSLHLNGTKLTNTLIEGAPITTGVCDLNSNVTFLSDVKNLGTLHNLAGYAISTTFKGKVTNLGRIANNANGGYLDADFAAGITNHAFFQVGYLNFSGNNTRSINGINAKAIKGICYVNDSMTFTDENHLPNLRVTTPYVLTIDTNSVLTCDDIDNNSFDQIRNRGSIRTNRTTNNYSEFKYDKLSAWFYNTNISSLLVESYGEQQHPFTENAINYWWRLKPTPVEATDTLKKLLLSYDESLLNRNDESALDVYFSPNAGLNWRKIEEDVTVDTASNTIQLVNAPSYGHYVVSGQGLEILSFKPTINRAEPRVFGNKGSVTIYGFGVGLNDSMKLTLKKTGSSDITADTMYLTDVKGESFLAVFNVDMANVGTYSLHIETPGEDPMVLDNYFKIEEAEWPKPWVVLSGRDRFLLNRWQTFNINYGNLTNVDAQGVPLFFVVNDIPDMEVIFPDVQISVPKSFTDDGWTQWKDTTIDLFYISDSLTGFEGQRMRIYPFYIPFIPALSSNSVRVKIKATQNLDMTVWVTDPLIQGFEKLKKANTPPEVAACLAKVAGKYSWDKAIDLIPGYDCYKLAYKVTETGANHVLKDPNEPEKPATWGSWLVTGWGWAWSIADCAGDLIPISKGVKIGKDLIGLGFDIKSNYDASQECWDKFRAKNKGKHKSNAVNSFDPNEITGPIGYGDDHYISSESNLVYTVFFENKDSATAPASDVIVYDTIDVDQFDLNTFSFNSITISDSTYKIQAFSKEFRLLIDLSPRINSIVQVTGNLDTISGEIKVTYLTLDKSTLEFIEDVDLGFLPPNKVSPEGEGNFSYSVSLAKDIQHDEEIINKALIFFDFNKPIATNIHSNKIDKKAPQSEVISLSPITTDSTFIVEWAGVDPGCGIQTYSVFVSINDSAYVAWKSNTSLMSDTFYGRDKYDYKFYSVATDSLGLSEIAPDKADTETSVIDKSGINELNKMGVSVFPNPVHDQLYVDLTQAATTNVSFYQLDGRLAKVVSVARERNTIDITDLEYAIYIIKISNNNLTTYGKIIVQE